MIGFVSESYGDTRVVLILNSGICSSSVSTPDEEKLLRVLSHRCIQQMWTLQGTLLQRS
ncbi:hypothetical protein F5141DRAFT_1131130 [Pisolithus sp. B1]|nr:hypothetical protein F5141DRAFT_1131130 [Pisolithus sp. B1]